jgi:hypothetical protein
MGGRGNLNVHIQAHSPEQLCAGERAFYQQLRNLGQTAKNKRHWWK